MVGTGISIRSRSRIGIVNGIGIETGAGAATKAATGTQLRLRLNLDYNLDWEQDRNGELKRELSETGTLEGCNCVMACDSAQGPSLKLDLIQSLTRHCTCGQNLLQV